MQVGDVIIGVGDAGLRLAYPQCKTQTLPFLDPLNEICADICGSYLILGAFRSNSAL